MHAGLIEMWWWISKVKEELGMARGGSCMSSNLMHVWLRCSDSSAEMAFACSLSDVEVQQTFSPVFFLELQHVELVACLQVRSCTIRVQAEVVHCARQ